tara:strand:+ start:1363 stop:1578 length:216 start_codon:yes stop_codon:yes gene_type:complete
MAKDSNWGEDSASRAQQKQRRIISGEGGKGDGPRSIIGGKQWSNALERNAAFERGEITLEQWRELVRKDLQ